MLSTAGVSPIMFQPLPDTAQDMVQLDFEGQPLRVPAGISVAAALLQADCMPTRTTPVKATPRAPYCMMGVCFDCLVEIDGIPNRQACMIAVAEGMQVRRQRGAPALASQ
jgi:predicted molibdopterin-dependent oxidoreductase YjgC